MRRRRQLAAIADAVRHRAGSEHLAEFGIPVVHHLPGVGQSLQDHYSAPIKLRCKLPVTVNDVMLSNAKKLKAGLEYYMFHRGPLSMISSPAALFARTRPELASPDIKCSISPFSAERPQDGLHRFSGFTMIAYQLRPESRGEIKLKSPDPFDAPAVYPNYLATETDQRTIVAGLKLCRQILATPAHAALHRGGIPARPGGRRRDEELLDYARRRGGTVYHPTSTCKMGSDPMAVVDAELRVHGHRRAARRRRLDHADGGLRQHQRRDDHDRREGRRHGAPAAAAGGVNRRAIDLLGSHDWRLRRLNRLAGIAVQRCRMPSPSLQGAQSDDRENHAIRRELGLSRPHLLRPDEDARRRRASVRRDRARNSRSRSTASATRRSGRTRSPMFWSFSSPTSSSMSCLI